MIRAESNLEIQFQKLCNQIKIEDFKKRKVGESKRRSKAETWERLKSQSDLKNKSETSSLNTDMVFGLRFLKRN
jgi:hypothetical protein